MTTLFLALFFSLPSLSHGNAEIPVNFEEAIVREAEADVTEVEALPANSLLKLKSKKKAKLSPEAKKKLRRLKTARIRNDAKIKNSSAILTDLQIRRLIETNGLNFTKAESQRDCTRTSTSVDDYLKCLERLENNRSVLSGHAISPKRAPSLNDEPTNAPPSLDAH